MSNTFDIFERAVQDPCSDAVDNEDCDTTSINEKSLLEDVDLQNLKLGKGKHKLTKSKTTPDYYERSNMRHKYINNSNKTYDGNKGVSSTFLRSTSNTINTNTRNRTNSCAFIHQSSRRPSFNNVPRKTGSVVSIELEANDNNNNNNNLNDNGTTLLFIPLSRESSCCAIPSHVYGLEKYVSCELDELSVCDDYDYSNKNTMEPNSPTSSSDTENLIFENIKNNNSNSYISSPVSLQSSEVDLLSIPSHIKKHFNYHFPLFHHDRNFQQHHSVHEQKIFNEQKHIINSNSKPANAFDECDRHVSAIKTSLSNAFST